MIKSMLFIISFFTFYIGLLLIKKDNKKRSFILWSIILLFSTIIINSLMIFFIGKFNISVTLTIRTILFFILSIPIYYLIINRKRIQEYSIAKTEVLSLIIITLLILSIGYYRFNKFDLVFETTDPAVHYLDAKIFSESGKLIEKNQPDYIYKGNGSGSMFLGYTTVGTVFQILDECNMGIPSHVVSFIIFELFVLLVTALSMFYAFKYKKQNGKLNLILSYLLIILFILGYPFNNLIFGYHYLGLSILIMMLLFIFVREIISDKIKWYYVVNVALYSFSVFTTYYMFVPIVFGTLGVYFLYEWKVKKQISFKDSLIYICGGLVISFGLGMYYYFLRNYLFVSDSLSTTSIFKLEGYIYRNLIGNFILIIPIIIYKLVLDIKKKQISLFDISFVFNLIFVIVLFILFYNDVIASYYYYKLYYVLWAISFAVVGIALNEKNHQIHGYVVSNTILLFVLFIFQITDIDNTLYNKNPLLNNVTFSKGIEDIYWFNQNRNDKELYPPIYTYQEMKELNKINNKYSSKFNNLNVYYYGNIFHKLWFYSTTKVNPLGGSDLISDFYASDKEEKEIIENEKIIYLLCSKDYKKQCYIKNFAEIYRSKNFVLTFRQQ